MAGQTLSVRRSIAWGTIAFGVVLAVVIGVRLDEAALAVIAGVSCGVAASIPTGYLVVFLLRRRDVADDTRTPRSYGRDMARSTPVVVIASPAAAQLPPPATWPAAHAALAPAKREFAVIGEEAADDAFEYW
jgi:hypothetical protein